MPTLKIYVASSWRNEFQPMAVHLLRETGHEVYDFKNLVPGDHGFHWSDVDPDWERWSVDDYREGLEHPLAVSGFGKDFGAMQWADVCVVAMPCGRSAHLEAGWFCGQEKPCLFWYPESVPVQPDGPGSRPELMVKMGDGIVQGIVGLEQAIESLAALKTDMGSVPS